MKIKHRALLTFLALLGAALFFPVAPGIAQSSETARVIVTLRAPAAGVSETAAPPAIAWAQRQFAASAAAAGAREIARMQTLPFVVLEVPRNQLARLAADPQVERITTDLLMVPHLIDSVPLIKANQVHPFTTGADVSIAIVDDGVDAGHPFLGGRVIDEACFSTNAGLGITSLCPGGGEEAIGSGAAAPCALNGCDHGTHVAGIAAGYSASFTGVAPGASIVAVQVFSSIGGSLGSYTSDQLRALDWLAATNFDPPLAAVNMSLGTTSLYSNQAACDSDGAPLKTAVANLRAKGVITVASAGNNGSSTGLSLPACLSNVVSVGATTKTLPESVIPMSNSASFLTLLAPGIGIVSSIPDGFFCPIGYPAGYCAKTGTSMAAPHVAGAIALLRSSSPGTSPDLLIATLVNTGVPITDTRNGIVKPRIDVLEAYKQLHPGTPRAYLSLISRAEALP